MRLTLTLKDASRVLGTSTQSVRKLVKQKTLDRLPELRHVLIPAASLLRYLGMPVNTQSAQHLVNSLAQPQQTP